MGTCVKNRVSRRKGSAAASGGSEAIAEEIGCERRTMRRISEEGLVQVAHSKGATDAV